MSFIKTHLISGAYRCCYTDTDSICFATTKTNNVSLDADIESQYRAIFDPIIKPEMKDSWELKWKSWFVTTNSIEDQRFPGKLKLEFSMTKGHFVALAPKTYMASSHEDTKFASKGIPHTVEVTMQVRLLFSVILICQNYLKTLYDNEQSTVTFPALRLNNKTKEMERLTLTKTGLTDLFCKFYVSDDKITCYPLFENNEFL